jgi:hypothetical protein
LKGSFVKLSADKWRVRWNDYTAFYSYRWLAWALAGLSLPLPGRSPESLPRDAGLLLLLGVINVCATAMAQSYVRLARRRPLLMSLDVVAGAVVIWLSGGGPLPFLPYALGALVLPALIGGWGAALASAAFIALDLSGLALIGGAASLPLLALRAAIPLAFTSCWVAAGRLLVRGEGGVLASEPGLGDGGARLGPTGDAGPTALRVRGFVEPEQGAPGGQRGTSAQQRGASQMEPSHRADAARHAIFDLAPGENITFPAAIDQMALSFSRQEGVELRFITLGTVRPLTGAQHSVLLRVTQEALLNVHQHAHAHTVLITLTFEPRAVTLAIQDDGVGLLDGTYQRPGMHALRAARYRLAELDGQLAVFESESGGVTLRATLPLD